MANSVTLYVPKRRPKHWCKLTQIWHAYKPYARDGFAPKFDQVTPRGDPVWSK